MKNVLVLVGSLRRDSINRVFAEALGKLAGDRMAFTMADLAPLPMYNEDLWADLPEAVAAFKAQADAADAFLFVMPEYNRSVPPVLINAVAWGSRPYGKSSFNGKPGAVVGASPGLIGTAAGQVHLRSILPSQGLLLMGVPEVYLSLKPGVIAEDRSITDDSTRAFLSGWTDTFIRFVERHG